MSGRRAANRIRGPQSALTDFLAANNISAAQIREDYIRRVREAEEASGTSAAAPAQQDEVAEVEEEEPVEAEAAASSKQKRKRKSEADGKKKDKKKSKKRKGGSDDDSDDALDDIYTYKKSKKLPGQLENCEVCDKRFTVTPYSKSGPNGGLLCTPCGKQLAKDTGTDKPAKKGPVSKKRRKLESDRLDGKLNRGPKTLQQLCIELIVKHYEELEEVGDLPEEVLKRLGQIFSKRRVLKPDTLRMFVRSDLDSVVITEAAYLNLEDYEHIFSTAQNIDTVVLNNACQFQDSSIEYMAQKAPKIRHVTLYAANLVTDDGWQAFFETKGNELETLRLSWLDCSFDLDTVSSLASHCTNLKRLKLYRCRQLGQDTIPLIASMDKLEHLSLHFSQHVPSEALLNLVDKIGYNLQTLSLIHFEDADDTFLTRIHDTCTKLRKLRLAENDTFSDAGFVSLFDQWRNAPLEHADFSSTRDVDNSNPDGPEETIGLGDCGLKALFEHSGRKLKKLNISSCRHITVAGFMDVFDGQQQYPELEEIDISFCNSADTVVVAGIYKTCPKLKKLVVFGCFNVDSVVVPSGILVIGAPKAQDAIEQFGNSGLDVEQALGGMLRLVEAAA